MTRSTRCATTRRVAWSSWRVATRARSVACRSTSPPGASATSFMRWQLHREVLQPRPVGRLELMARCYEGPFGRAPQHLPYRRARDVVHALAAAPRGAAAAVGPEPGSPWWRAVNERILREGARRSRCQREPRRVPPLLPPSTSGWRSSTTRPRGRGPRRTTARRRRLPRAPRPGGSGERGRALLHERRALPGALPRSARPRPLSPTPAPRPASPRARVAARRSLTTPLPPSPSRRRRARLRLFSPITRRRAAPRSGGCARWRRSSATRGSAWPGSSCRCRGSSPRSTPSATRCRRTSTSSSASDDSSTTASSAATAAALRVVGADLDLHAPGLLECVRDGVLTYAWPFAERHVWAPPNSMLVRLVRRRSHRHERSSAWPMTQQRRSASGSGRCSATWSTRRRRSRCGADWCRGS